MNHVLIIPIKPCRAATEGKSLIVRDYEAATFIRVLKSGVKKKRSFV